MRFSLSVCLGTFKITLYVCRIRLLFFTIAASQQFLYLFLHWCLYVFLRSFVHLRTSQVIKSLPPFFSQAAKFCFLSSLNFQLFGPRTTFVNLVGLFVRHKATLFFNLRPFPAIKICPVAVNFLTK